MKTTRREFLKTISVPLAGALFMSGCARKPLGPYLVLTDTEAKTLIALCEQLIPADEYGGATDAGVVHFFDKQLSNGGHYPDQLAFYRRGIALLNASCEKLHNARFASLDVAGQLAYLRELEKGKIADTQWKTADQRRFFNTLLDHTMQAFYGAPRHGANKHYLSYAMMGIEYPLAIGQNRYRELDE
jgi:gluconate 2-dehydrogenase gamma chain